MLAIASRISHVLCKPEGLVHEAYITLYAQGMSVAIIPIFIVTNAKRLSHLDNGESADPDSNAWIMRMTFYAFLFIVIFVKVYALERATMCRFVEDYNEDVHKLPDRCCFGKAGNDDFAVDEIASDLGHYPEDTSPEDSKVEPRKRIVSIDSTHRRHSERY